MILYHVSTDLTKDGYFYPRMPEIMALWEDNTNMRVCVSTSIEGCISAIPNSIKGVLNKNNSVCKVFRIDTEKLGIPRVDIIDSLELYTDDCVRDAEVTKEHWIMSKFIVPQEDIFYIRINGYESKEIEVIPSFIYLEASESNYADVWGYITNEKLEDEVFIATLITNLSYSSSETAFCQSFNFGPDEEFARFMESYLELHHPYLEMELKIVRNHGIPEHILNVNFDGMFHEIKVFYLILSQYYAEDIDYRQKTA